MKNATLTPGVGYSRTQSTAVLRRDTMMLWPSKKGRVGC
jgi:hypothetical protein